MFLAAADDARRPVTDERLADGALYPAQSDLREVSRAIAIGVVGEARACGLGRGCDDEIQQAVDAAMWWPDYEEYMGRRGTLIEVPPIFRVDILAGNHKQPGGSREPR